MNTPDFTRLSRKQLLEHFEQERQEWLAAGMSEADVYRIHFGEEQDKGRGGDYRVWLNERKHTRPDHKYAPGVPTAIDTVDPNGAWISGGRGGMDEVEFQTDLDNALSSLTELQRYCFVEVRLNERGYREVAAQIGKGRSVVEKAVKGAVEKIKKYF